MPSGPLDLLAGFAVERSNTHNLRVEEYLRRCAVDEVSDEALLELIYAEIVRRDDTGESPTLDEYVQRFSHLENRLRKLFELREALSNGNPSEVASLDVADRLLMQRMQSFHFAHPFTAGSVVTGRSIVPQSAQQSGQDRESQFGEDSGQADTILPNSDAFAVTILETPEAQNQFVYTNPRFPTIPGYIIEAELGRGGMGVVYRAHQIGLKRLVALKMIVSGAHAQREELDRFRREAEAIARLQHPHIVQVYAIGEHDGLPYFSLEYCRNGSLDKKLRGTPLPPRKAAEFVAKLAEAVQVAHEHGVIHRDLKPANVLLGDDGQPKVTDFGLAKQLDVQGSGQTVTGAIVGTPSYMAPEQARGQSRHVGPAADVYALGAILYELLTGRPPFKSTTPMETILQVLEQEPVSLYSYNRAIPPDLNTICTKCLDKSPERRYGSARALSEELIRFGKGEPIRARAISGASRLWRWCQRNPVIAGLISAVTITLALGTVVSTLFAIRSEQNGAIARENARLARLSEKSAVDSAAIAREKENLANQLAADESKARRRAELLLYSGQIALARKEWEDGNVRQARAVLDACQRDLRGWEHDYMFTLCHKQQRTIEGHAARVNCVAYSPDGTQCASGSDDKTLRIWDARTGRPIQTITGHSGPIRSLAFSRDSARIVSASDDRLVIVWDTLTGRSLLKIPGHRGPVNSVALSPDGSRIASGSSDNTLKVWDVSNGHELLTLTGHTASVRSVTFSPDGSRIASCGGEIEANKNNDPAIRVWDTQSGQNVLTLSGHTAALSSVVFSPDGRWIVSGSGDHSIRVWDAQTGQERRKLNSLLTASVAFSHDGTKLVSGSWDGSVRIWDAKSWAEIVALKGHVGQVNSVAFSPDGSQVVSGSTDKTVEVWNARASDNPVLIQGYSPNGIPEEVSSIVFTRDFTRVLSAGWEKTLRLSDARTGLEIRSYSGLDGVVRSLAFNPEETQFAAVGNSNIIRIWDTRKSQDIQHAIAPGHRLSCVTYSPDGKRILTGNQVERDNLTAWDAQTLQKIGHLKGHHWSLSQVAFSPAGKKLITCGSDHTVRIWDAVTFQLLRTITAHSARVRLVAISKDGTRIASAGIDGKTIQVWDAETGKAVITIPTGTDHTSAILFSLDGRRLLSGNSRGIIKVWDTSSAQQVLSLKAHDGSVITLAFNPDGTQLASGSSHGTIRIWDASAPDRSNLATLRVQK